MELLFDGSALVDDDVEKGAAGSGQHPNAGSASRSANLKSRIARASGKKTDHLAAAKAHTMAGNMHIAAGNYGAAKVHTNFANAHTTIAAEK